MRKILLAGCAALTMMSVPAALQAQSAPMTDAPASTAAAPTMTPAQKAMYDAWPAAQKTDYDAWPNDYKVYYWSLNPEQQKGYWALTADQRGQIYKMTPEQRQMAWNSIMQQMNGQTPTAPAGQANPSGAGMPAAGAPDPQSAGQAAPTAMPAGQDDQSMAGQGAMTPPPPPASDMNKKYPVCSKTVTDSCRNRGGK